MLFELILLQLSSYFFFSNAATTTIYTLSLHDALPISVAQFAKTLEENGALQYSIIIAATASDPAPMQYLAPFSGCAMGELDRKSTRLNSSHSQISYAVFCLKKKKFLIEFSKAPNVVCL